jgi:hypothetical protein
LKVSRVDVVKGSRATALQANRSKPPEYGARQGSRSPDATDVPRRVNLVYYPCELTNTASVLESGVTVKKRKLVYFGLRLGFSILSTHHAYRICHNSKCQVTFNKSADVSLDEHLALCGLRSSRVGHAAVVVSTLQVHAQVAVAFTSRTLVT